VSDTPTPENKLTRRAGALGVAGLDADTVDLTTVANRRALLSAVAKALAEGRTTPAVSRALVDVIRCACDAANEEAEQVIAKLLDRVRFLEGARR
jgi:hypothetical protein